MHSKPTLRVACAIAALTLISLMSMTCGGSSHNNVSQAQAQAICMQTSDFARAYDAFVTKQRPVFQGN